jgi:hypothetical protein
MPNYVLCPAVGQKSLYGVLYLALVTNQQNVLLVYWTTDQPKLVYALSDRVSSSGFVHHLTKLRIAIWWRAAAAFH